MEGAKPKLSDVEFRAATRRRYIWEFGADLERTNWWLFITCSFLLVAVICLSVTVTVIFTRPPYILSEDEGYVMYRSTQVYRLDETRIRTYLDVVLSKLFNQNPGVYDLSPIAPLATPSVLKAFIDRARDTAQDRVSNNERRFFSLVDAKRYNDPRFSKYIVAAVRGEIAYFRQGRLDTDLGSDGSAARSFSSTVTYLVYLQVVRPTIANPWGLVTTGLSEQRGENEKAVLQKAVPFENTILPDGTFVSKRQRDELLKKAKTDKNTLLP